MRVVVAIAALLMVVGGIFVWKTNLGKSKQYGTVVAGRTPERSEAPRGSTTPSVRAIESDPAGGGGAVDSTGDREHELRSTTGRSPQLVRAMARLEREVGSGDSGRMLRALNHFLYQELLQREEIVAGLVLYLRHDSPEVRLNAASGLLMVDDDSGVEVLREMVRSPEPISAKGADAEFRKAVPDAPESFFGADLRRKAARLLTRYRRAEAAEDIVGFAELMGGLAGPSMAKLGRIDLVEEKIREETKFTWGSASAMLNVALRGANQFRPQLEEAFEYSRTPFSHRTAAAWSLARLTGDSEYIDYLVENIGGRDKRVAKYLGSLHTPEATEALVEALDSSSSMTKDYALVNLLFNRAKPHPQAVAKLFEYFENPKGRKFGWSIISQTSSLLDNPELNEVIRRSWRDSNLKAWETRRNWSPYAWLDDYVLELKYDPYDRSGERFKW